jgi:hypothetical protein
VRGLRPLLVLLALAALWPPPGSANHDQRHLFAGEWTISFQSGRTGTFSFGLVSDAEGLAAMNATFATAPCEEPSDYYVGTYIDRNQAGVVANTGSLAGCTTGDDRSIYVPYRPSSGVCCGYVTAFLDPSGTTFSGTNYFDFDGDAFAFTVVDTFAGTFAEHFTGDGAEDSAADRPCFEEAAPGRRLEASSAINEVRVVAVTPEVCFHRAGAPEDEWLLAEKDTVLKQGDEISCDPDGSVTLQFADNSTVVVRNTSQLKIASFFTEGGVVRTEILLKMGEVAAKVNKSEATKSDFRIKSPTAGAGVRGTEFSVSYDPVTRVGKTSVTDGEVEVQPLAFHDPYTQAATLRGAPLMLAAGQEVQVSTTAVGAVAAVGQSTAPASAAAITKAGAIAKVKQLLRKNARICKLTTKWVKARKTPKGYRISARVLLNGVKGTAIWNVTGPAPKPFNRLATRIAAGCG